MIYLLAKYTLLFLLASALGFVLGYWWSRRSFVDVSESYQDLRKAAERTDTANWELLWKRLDALPQPQKTDLSPVVERLDDMDSAVRAIPRPETLDLAPLVGQVGALERRVDEIPRAETVDLAPLVGQVSALERRVDEIPRAEQVDLAPLDGRLQSIESEIGRLGKRLSRSDSSSSTQTREPARRQEAGEPRILSAALYGQKDDLKSISGVGPKLERLLNKNGIYYFWQVATWSHEDIDVIDQRLDSFKGRISRDDWVAQARHLSRTPGAATMPSD